MIKDDKGWWKMIKNDEGWGRMMKDDEGWLNSIKGSIWLDMVAELRMFVEKFLGVH